VRSDIGDVMEIFGTGVFTISGFGMDADDIICFFWTEDLIKIKLI